MKKRKHIAILERRRGAALIMAIALLALFVSLGMMYIRNMNIELEKADYDIRTSRARLLAEGGVYAAIGELQRAIAANQQVQVLDKPLAYDFSTYGGIRGVEGLELAPLENIQAVANVTISDECGKVNLNHVPASVLQRVLGIDGATARNITGSLPRGNEAPPENAEVQPKWLLGPDELLSRNLLTPEQYAAVDTSLLTTYTVADHDHPEAFINLNSAAPSVLAAILDISIEAAGQVAEKKPFKTLEALSVAAGKSPETFNIKPDPNTPTVLPAQLAFESRCFRIASKSAIARGNSQRSDLRATGQVEAVVLFHADNSYEIVYWDTQRDADPA